MMSKVVQVRVFCTQFVIATHFVIRVAAFCNNIQNAATLITKCVSYYKMLQNTVISFWPVMAGLGVNGLNCN